MPSHLPADVRRRLMPIRLLVLDVDGVLTDGALVFSSRGEETKRFCVRDGLGIRLLLDAGLTVAVISGRSSDAVTVRCRELGIADAHIAQGSRDKPADLEAIAGPLGVRDHEVAAMGDDLPDLPLLERVGFAACPADAAPEVAAACDLVCRAGGGQGAVREIAELLLKAQGRWLAGVSQWISRAQVEPL